MAEQDEADPPTHPKASSFDSLTSWEIQIFLEEYSAHEKYSKTH